MATEVFQTKEWNDLVFEGRNKEYGAYVLRMEHERNMAAGLVTAFGLLGLLFILGIVLSKYVGTVEVPEIPPIVLRADQFKIENLIKPKFEETPKTEAPKIKTEQYNQNMKIVADNQANNFADNEKLNKSVVSSTTNDKGTDNPGNATLSGDGDGKKPEIVESTPPAPVIYNQANIEVQPLFPGGENALNKFLSSHIRYTQEAKEIGKQGNVYLTFIIDEYGKPANISVARGLCCGLNEAAIKAIQEMPDWTPGKMGDKAVKVLYSLKVTFKLD